MNFAPKTTDINSDRMYICCYAFESFSESVVSRKSLLSDHVGLLGLDRTVFAQTRRKETNGSEQLRALFMGFVLLTLGFLHLGSWLITGLKSPTTEGTV
jgi:hypothetical protein